jgi:hypothetical protein
VQGRFLVVVEGARSCGKIGIFEQRTPLAACPSDGLVVGGVALAFGGAIPETEELSEL